MSIAAAIDAYLAEVSAEMGGNFWEQQSVRDELRAHISALAADHEQSGIDAVAALRQALRDLGHPADVGAALRTSRGRRALKRARRQPAGAILLARTSNRPHPPARLLIGLASLAVVSIAIAVAYAWP